MREVPVQSSISFYILSIPHAECITMQMPNLFFCSSSLDQCMVNECSESYRNGQELSNVYTYLRHHIPHLLPRSPACSLLRQLSQLLLFSDSFQQSAFVVVLFYLFLFAAATTIWAPHSFVLRNWKISCAKKISTTTMQKKTKSFEDWEQQGKRTQKVVQICARYLMQGTDVVRTTRTMIASLVILSTRKIMENRKWR